MNRFFNLLFCLLSFAGLIAAFYFLIDGSGPCSSDGCMIRLEIIFALVLFIFFAPIFYITVKKEIKVFRENKSRNTNRD